MFSFNPPKSTLGLYAFFICHGEEEKHVPSEEIMIVAT
jgi:hypothetical protein